MDELKKTSGYIMVSPEDVPTISQIQDAISRLNKTVNVLFKIRGDQDENPESLVMVASFLESFVNTYKKQLRK